MKNTILFLAFFFIGVVSLEAHTFAQFILGGGYEQTITITQTGLESWTGTVTLSFGLDESWPAPYILNGITQKTRYTTITVKPWQTRLLHYTGGSEAVAGYLSIQGLFSDDSTLLIRQACRFRAGDSVTEAGASESSEGRWFVFPVDAGKDLFTGVAWAPITKGTYALHFYLRDLAGAIVSSRIIRMDGHQAKVISEIFDMPDNFEGVCQLSTEGEIIAVTVMRIANSDGRIGLTAVEPIAR